MQAGSNKSKTRTLITFDGQGRFQIAGCIWQQAQSEASGTISPECHQDLATFLWVAIRAMATPKTRRSLPSTSSLSLFTFLPLSTVSKWNLTVTDNVLSSLRFPALAFSRLLPRYTTCLFLWTTTSNLMPVFSNLWPRETTDGLRESEKKERVIWWSIDLGLSDKQRWQSSHIRTSQWPAVCFPPSPPRGEAAVHPAAGS